MRQQALKEKEVQVTRANSKQIVIRMIKRDYSTEEIASLVLNFSQDDVNALRTELAAEVN